jgi:predicted nuclease of predicted toxin-antitoxin system
MPLSPALAEWLASLGHDAIHASSSGLSQAPDSEILSRAIAERRVIVTADLDFPRLLAAIRETGPGLILLRAEIIPMRRRESVSAGCWRASPQMNFREFSWS